MPYMLYMLGNNFQAEKKLNIVWGGVGVGVLIVFCDQAKTFTEGFINIHDKRLVLLW